MEWQPIKTAPKNGTSILVATESHSDGVTIVAWMEAGLRYVFADMEGDIYCDATHWMPLPPAPDVAPKRQPIQPHRMKIMGFGHVAKTALGIHIDQWGVGPFVIFAGGKEFRFEDSDRFGPSLINMSGDISERQPGARSAFWIAHKKWVEQGRRTTDGVACIWQPGNPTLIRKTGDGLADYEIVKNGDSLDDFFIVP